MAVTITSKNPGDDRISVGWNATPQANVDANVYVATDPADFNTPDAIVVPADQANQLPGINDFTATVTGLTPGTNYYLMCEADGLESSMDSFTTTGNLPGPAPTVHLVPKGLLGDGPVWNAHPFEWILLKVQTVKISNPAQRLSGVPVEWKITSGAGHGVLKKAKTYSGMLGVARDLFICAKKGTVQITATSPLADNSVVLTVNIH
ncbi:MAG TPA: fibronectin type III domain-containing protein [bacterium]|nr:fibronectin type III domain-containing protein [bacterium]